MYRVHQVKTIRGKKRKHNLLLHTLAMPGLALSSVFPVWWHPPPARSTGCCTAWGHHWARTALGQHCAPRGHGWDRAPANTSTHGRAARQPEEHSAPHSPRDLCPTESSGMVGEHMGLHWLVPLPPSAPQSSQPQELKHSFGTSMGRKLQKNVCYHWIPYL